MTRSPRVDFARRFFPDAAHRPRTRPARLATAAVTISLEHGDLRK